VVAAELICKVRQMRAQSGELYGRRLAADREQLHACSQHHGASKSCAVLVCVLRPLPCS
jgi:hypothetical protein